MSAKLSLNWGDWGRLFHWRCAEIDFDFLWGTMSFWDPTDHVFRFGLDELCRHTRSFLSSWVRVSLPLAVLAQDVGHCQALADLLGVDVRVVQYIFV